MKLKNFKNTRLNDAQLMQFNRHACSQLVLFIFLWCSLLHTGTVLCRPILLVFTHADRVGRIGCLAPSVCLFVSLSVCPQPSRFDSNSNRTIPIRFIVRFDSIRKWRADSKFSSQPHLPSYHKPRSLFNKKLQRCAVVIEIYFMFMILCLCIASAYTLASDRAILFEEPWDSAHLCSSLNT